MSIRKLAAELNVSPKSLYHHVPNKAALMRGVYARLLRDFQIEVPDSADWQTQFRGVASSFRSLMRHNRGMAHAFSAQLAPLERNLLLYEHVFSIMMGAGIAKDVVAQMGHVVINMLVGFVVAETRGRFAEEALDTYSKMITKSPDQFPVLNEVGITAPVEDMDRLFDILVDGILVMISAQLK
ncbi:MAG: TetR/AcrR family transcriptional regulator C-terminal domain-containing protein [Chloroflexota bacterium]